MSHTFRYSIFVAVAVLATLASCSDGDVASLSHGQTDAYDSEALIFAPFTTEQIDIQQALGSTRAEAAADSAIRRANTPSSRPFQGSNTSGLYLHRMPLPFMEIHPRTASAPVPQLEGLRYHRNQQPLQPQQPPQHPQPSSRAPLSSLASTDNFHSSMTIWGFLSETTPEHNDATLFNHVLVSKVNNWRTSLHWPYDGDGGGTRTMRFYAVAPSMDDLELTITNSPDHETQPTFTYRVPDDIDEQKDLLYGVSDLVNIALGPKGAANHTGYDAFWQGKTEPTGSWSREAHLGQDDKIVDLRFRHILTAVRFVQGNIPTKLRITSITLNSIRNRGTYDPDKYDPDDPATSAWTIDDASTGHYTINVDYTPTNYTEGSNVYIDGGNVLFLMPHTCISGAELEVALTDTNGTPGNTADDRNHTIKVSLSGDVWKPGYTVTYKVTVGELRGDYYLAVQKDGGEASSNLENDVNPHGSNSGSFKVHSYRMFQDYSSSEAGTATGPSHPIHWKVNAIYPANSDGTRSTTAYTSSPSWLSVLTGWNVGDHVGTPIDGGSDKSASYTFTAASGQTYSHTTILEANSEPAQSWDLSKCKVSDVTDGSVSYKLFKYDKTTTRTTSNCYIINRKQGSYSFPMVYGNGITDGVDIASDNTTCYDHQGDIIKKPWILDQLNKTKTTTVTDGNTTTVTETQTNYGTDASSFSVSGSDVRAEVLWQSETGLVHTISRDLSGGTNASMIGFSAGNDDEYGEHVKPANCIIALKGKKRTRTKTTVVSTVSESTSDSDAPTSTSTTGDLDVGPFPRTQTITEVTISSGTKTTKTTTVTQNDWSVAGNYDYLWYWHIWMTDEVYPNAFRNQTGKTVGSTVLRNSSGTEQYKIMPVNLGWVPARDDYTVYENREAWLEIVQCASGGSTITNSADPCYVKISQLAQQIPEAGTSLTFQWGFPVTASGTPAATWTYAGAWSSTTGKTLYDPCPPGYQLPPHGLFTGDVTASNGNGTGWFFFPQAGISTGAEKLRQGLFYLPVGNYWTGDATPTAITLGSDGTLGTSTSFGASTALPIRPIGEYRQ